MTRRDASNALLLTAASYSRVLGANDRIGMGFIGLGNRGDQVHDAFLEHAGANQTVAVCDIQSGYLDLAVSKSRATPKRYRDYRRLLEDKSVDAVAIATPDHWHALMFIDACNAGKDVYVEKPLCLTVVEGRKMVEAATRARRVTQVGIQRRSSPSLREAAELVRSGAIGKVTVASGFHLHNEWPNGLGMNKDAPPMSAADWDMWLGPAPMVPYDRNRAYYNFRWFFDYSGGQLTNFGVHYMDMLRWCIGKDSPRAVTAMGGRYAGIGDNREIPDTLDVLWNFDDCTVAFVQRDGNAAPANPGGREMELRGTKGTMYLNGSSWEIVPERITEVLYGSRTPLDRVSERRYGASRKPAIEARQGGAGSVDTAGHARNFLECVRTRAACNCDILTGHLSTLGPLIGNIALRTKSYLEWDAAAEKFTNNKEANRYLHYEYRAPYKLA
jgi:predicted dehydrogenase